VPALRDARLLVQKAHRLGRALLLLPVPVGELFAEG
jgi:hypothetical protein